MAVGAFYECSECNSRKQVDSRPMHAVYNTCMSSAGMGAPLSAKKELIKLAFVMIFQTTYGYGRRRTHARIQLRASAGRVGARRCRRWSVWRRVGGAARS